MLCDKRKVKSTDTCWEVAGLVVAEKKRKLLLGGLLDITVDQINA